MHYVGWMVAFVAVGLLLGPEERWAVAVLAAGPVLLLLALRESLPPLRRRAPLSGPRAVDAEAQHIRELQDSIEERTRSMKTPSTETPSTEEEGHER